MKKRKRFAKAVTGDEKWIYYEENCDETQEKLQYINLNEIYWG